MSSACELKLYGAIGFRRFALANLVGDDDAKAFLSVAPRRVIRAMTNDQETDDDRIHARALNPVPRVS